MSMLAFWVYHAEFDHNVEQPTDFPNNSLPGLKRLLFTDFTVEFETQPVDRSSKVSLIRLHITSKQGGPLPVIIRVVTALIGVIVYNPSYLFTRPFILFITSMGPLCTTTCAAYTHINTSIVRNVKT